ncbi:MAG: hypothetical protein ACE5I1_25130, partial [bacterium]
MHRIKRREFLKLGIGSAAFLGATPVLAGCKTTKSITEPAQINASVAAIRGNNLSAMTRDAIDAIGG